MSEPTPEAVEALAAVIASVIERHREARWSGSTASGCHSCAEPYIRKGEHVDMPRPERLERYAEYAQMPDYATFCAHVAEDVARELRAAGYREPRPSSANPYRAESGS